MLVGRETEHYYSKINGLIGKLAPEFLAETPNYEPLDKKLTIKIKLFFPKLS